MPIMHNILTFLQSWAMVATWASVVVVVVSLVVLAVVVRLKGAHFYWKTMFGPALIFDSTDDDNNAIRLLNVGNKFQSVCYVSPDKRWDLACIYHQYMEQLIELVACKQGAEGCGASADASAGAGAGASAGAADATDAGGSASPCANTNAQLADWRGHVLVIGGGGFSLPKWLLAHCPHAQVTCVEIDPRIIELAREHFFVDEACAQFCATGEQRLHVVCDDGWKYLQKCASEGTKFDVIVNDAFGGARPLIALNTHDGAQALAACLTPNGVYLANCIAALEGAHRKPLDAALDGCNPVFSHVYVIGEDDDEPRVIANNVLIASQVHYPLAPAYCIKEDDDAE